MRRLFQWIKQRREAQLYDIANESWDPVGPTDTNIDWSSWLQDEGPRRHLQAKARPRPQVIARETSRSGEPQLRAAVLPTSTHKEASPTAASQGTRGRSRFHTPPPSEGQWVEVLKSYGEHLTEEELLIIRQQLVAR